MPIRFKGSLATAQTKPVETPKPVPSFDWDAHRADVQALVASSGLPYFSCDNLLRKDVEILYKANTVRNSLVTKEEKAWLLSVDMKIEDLLNGLWTTKEQPQVERLFAAWNKKLGRELFKV